MASENVAVRMCALGLVTILGLAGGCAPDDAPRGPGTLAAGAGAAELVLLPNYESGLPSFEASIPVSSWGAYNPECPLHPPHEEVQGAPRGACCYRSSPNSQRVPMQLAETGTRLVETEYRLNHQRPVNHPLSLGQMALVGSSNDRNDLHQWNMLWRIERPYENGVPVAGMGHISIGWGGYNCDGTHSFFGPTAAPTGVTAFPGGDQADRWERTRTPVRFEDPSSPEGRVIVSAQDDVRENLYTPLVRAADLSLSWELIANAFVIESIDLSEAGLDCSGSFAAGSRYQAHHYFTTYAVVEDNHYVENGIEDLTYQTFAQLLAFGTIAKAEDRMTLDPRTGGTPRCQITTAEAAAPAATRTCRWIKLPTALCPRTPDERASWRCHIGAERNHDGNNGEDLPVKCSPLPPTGPLGDDPPSDGQCCDPQGDPTAGLPACNAWPIRNEYVAAAAEITQEVLTGLPPKCL